MKSYAKISGRTFEILSKPTRKVKHLLFNASHPWAPDKEDNQSIFDTYERPSSDKIAIFEDWCNFFSRYLGDNITKAYLFIPTHNSFFFSIAVAIGKELYYITPGYNYLITLSADLLNEAIPNWQECHIFEGVK